MKSLYYEKLDIVVKNKHLRVAFKKPIDKMIYYRIFKKPTGRYVALIRMSEAKGGWEFIGSISLYK